MEDNTLVVVALAGLALVCLGMIFVAFVLLLRFAGSRPVGFLSMIFGDTRENEQVNGRMPLTAKPDLRTIAEAHDFDAVLAKHVVQDAPESQIIARAQTPAQAAPPTAADTMFGEPPRLVPRERRGNVRRDDDDDLFGDMLE